MPLILEFGSRSGSWFALAFFTLLFGVLAFAVAREIRLRSFGTHTALGRILGLGLFIIPLSLVYVSMLSGFYDAEMSGATVRLRYLYPGVVVEIPLSQTTARVAPAYRGRARLVLSSRGGEYASATARRAGVEDAMRRFNQALPPATPLLLDLR